MEYNVKTSYNQDVIIQETNLMHAGEIVSQMYRGVIKLQDKGVREALISLGWVPPKSCPHCSGTGDVHTIDGQWMGECDCADSEWMRTERDAKRYRFWRNREVEMYGVIENVYGYKFGKDLDSSIDQARAEADK